MEVLLVMFRDGGEHRPFRLSKEATIIGRREDCDLRIAVGDVSRKHCRIVMVDGAEGPRVEDLGSSNGTFVNGTRVQNATLAAGDTLQVGPVAFVVTIDGEPSVADAKPSVRVPSPASRSGSGAGAATIAPAKTKVTLADNDFDELDILNDSTDSRTGGDDLLDLDPAEK